MIQYARYPMAANDPTIPHNPRCTKSRQIPALIDARGFNRHPDT
ncbi:MAG TPA: hypothetical protein VGL10_09215 [Gammaproteobacteria bacterium]